MINSNFVIDPSKCSHPAQVQEKNGVMRCLVCGCEVKPPRKKADKTEKDENRKSDDKTTE